MDAASAIRAAEGVFKHKLPIFCATCPKWYEGKAQGADTCTTQKPCGSPFSGLDFPEYTGTIPKAAAHQWCFVCGGAARYGIRATRSAVVFGLCEAHVHMTLDYKSAKGNANAEAVVYDDVGVVAPADLRRPKSLLRHIAEMDELDK